MNIGVLFNNLRLGYAPLSAYDFGRNIKNKEWRKTFFDSHLYIIAQRRELTFNNIVFTDKQVTFEIKQEQSSNGIMCCLPMIQENIFNEKILKDKTEVGRVRIQNRKNTIEEKVEAPFNGTQGLIFETQNLETKETKEIIWFTPEKLLQNYWKGHIEIGITGDFRKMLKYKVHYVGKSTEQNICDRLSNHSTFQEILTNQDALTYGNIPSNEIVVLLLRIEDNYTITQWKQEEPVEEMTEYFTNYKVPNDKTVSLDAEKAIIKHLQPNYNRILYKSFPKDGDLINKDVHNTIVYSIVDPITLVYDQGLIKGADDLFDRDWIMVK